MTGQAWISGQWNVRRQVHDVSTEADCFKPIIPRFAPIKIIIIFSFIHTFLPSPSMDSGPVRGRQDTEMKMIRCHTLSELIVDFLC